VNRELRSVNVDIRDQGLGTVFMPSDLDKPIALDLSVTDKTLDRRRRRQPQFGSIDGGAEEFVERSHWVILFEGAKRLIPHGVQLAYPPI
jgi:hypothetical protein